MPLKRKISLNVRCFRCKHTDQHRRAHKGFQHTFFRAKKSRFVCGNRESEVWPTIFPKKCQLFLRLHPAHAQISRNYLLAVSGQKFVHEGFSHVGPYWVENSSFQIILNLMGNQRRRLATAQRPKDGPKKKTRQNSSLFFYQSFCMNRLIFTACNSLILF